MVEQELERLFSDNDVCDIEEQQEVNVFDELKDHLEENYLELENLIMEQTPENLEDEESKAKRGFQHDFNKEGINNMINVHDHLD